MAAATAKQISEVTLYTLENAKKHSDARKAAIAAKPQLKDDVEGMLKWLDENYPKNPAAMKKQLTTSHETVSTPTQLDSMQAQEQGKAVRGGKGKKRERSSNYVTGSHVERNVTYERIKLSTGALLSLEPAVIKAIKFLDPKMKTDPSIKTSEWCDKAVANWEGQELNNAAIIRCSVINALLEKVQPC